VFLNAWLAPENGHADVFIPISVQTERAGHYTNFLGVASRFEQCVPPAPGVAHAQAVFEALAGSGGGAS
jgi:NADH-quinone oxidoreductase subunit G